MNLVKSSSSILRKFLIFNSLIFLVLGLFTFFYLNAIQPSLVKQRVEKHTVIINNTSNHIERLKINFEEKDLKNFLLSTRFLFQNLERVQFFSTDGELIGDTNVIDLGETAILKETFIDYKKSKQLLNFAERYWKKIKVLEEQTNIATNKNLYNYQFAGIIAKKIPNAKIFHCYRHPLDNILSIYRAHFRTGNEYSSSLVDAAKVYLDQKKVMKEYKNRFRSKIYDLNYDLLVSNPKEEIKSLISWLGWKWEDKYLSPHLNPRSVSTASKVQVRSPINSKSIGGWKNYKEMLRPAIEIISKFDKYRNLVL